MALEVLKKIGTITISLNPGREIALDVAKNGQFYLVTDEGNDAYGNLIHRVLEPSQLATKESAVALVQVIGALLVERDGLLEQLTKAVQKMGQAS